MKDKSKDPTDIPQKIKNHFRDKKYLIVVKSSSVKTNLRSLLCQYGFLPEHFLLAESVQGAKSFITQQKPFLVIFQNEVDNEGCIDLLEHHQTTCPERAQHHFFVLSEENTSEFAGQFLNFDLDGLVFLPLNAMAILQKIIRPILLKIKNAKENHDFDEARKSYYLKDKDGLKQKIQCIKDPKLKARAMWYMAQTLMQEERTNEAIQILDEALQSDEKNLRILHTLFELYYQDAQFDKAIEMANHCMSTGNIVAPKVEKYLNCALQVEDIELANRWLNTFKVDLVENPEEQVKSAHILAQLTQLSLEKRKSQLARPFFQMALDWANEVASVYEKLVPLAKATEKEKALAKELKKVASKSEELEWCLFHLESHTLEGENKLLQALKFIESGLEKKDLYLLALEESQKLGKKQSFISGIIDKAIRSFPEDRKLFLTYENS